jgi:alkanesulfonate monooxygenase SsuD/methylene tetrahydromethanopterin reductase-like flavin-dependent oxidoreductase (luciferase family)
LPTFTREPGEGETGENDAVLLTVFTEPQQGASYEDLLRVARHAQACGYDGFFRSDHYLAIGGPKDGQAAGTFGLPGPTDAWATLAALARETETIRLGTMLTCATFRLPGPLAITVAQVDAMSGGRVELGLGAGWFEAEHRAYGVPFPSLGERFDYEVVDSPALPKPVQTPRPPVIVGGAGARRTPALAARFADEFNVPFRPLDQTRAIFERVTAACEAIGRAPTSLRRSAAQVLCCGRDDAEVRRRAAAIGQDVDDLKANALCGTPAEIVDRIGQFSQAGASRLHLQVLDLTDLDHLDLVASEVMPQVA